jgi:hypothetical protein
MTDKPVSRRKLLAAAGTILLAGCGSDGSNQDSFGTRFAQETDAATATATRTATTAEPPDINIETRSETQTEQRERETTTQRETATETETETPSPGPEDVMEAARTSLRDAVTEFWSYGTDAETLVSVTAASIDFDEQAVLDELSTARDHLNEAETFGTGDQERIENHRTFAMFVEWLANTQVRVIDCYRTLQDVLEELYAEDLSDAGGARARFDSAVEDAQSQLNGFQERTRDGNTTAMEIVSRDAYDEKVDQWETEIDGFEELSDPLEKTRTGLDSFATGVDSYTRSDFQSAESELFGANNDFQLANSTLRTYSAPDSISGTVSTYRNMVEQLADGTGPLTESAAAGRRGAEEERVELLENGIDALRQSARVRNLPSYEQLTSETST